MSTVRRYDYDFVLPDAGKAYLDSLLGDDMLVGTGDKSDACPVVTFYDPNYVDSGNRVVCESPNGETSDILPANADMVWTVGVRSLLKQPTLAADIATHRVRLDNVRDKLMASDLRERLNAVIAPGVKIEWVAPKRQFDSSVTHGGFIYSGTSLLVKCYAVEPA